MTVIPGYERLRQEDCQEFEVDLGYIVNSRKPELYNRETLSQNNKDKNNGPSSWRQHWVNLGTESPDTSKVPRGLSMGS